MLPVLVGLALGLGVALTASGVMEAFLYRTSPVDPLTYLIVATLLLGMAALSSWLPARRAAAVDPIRVLNET